MSAHIRRHLDTRPVPPGLYTPRDVFDGASAGSAHLRSTTLPVADSVAVVIAAMVRA